MNLFIIIGRLVKDAEVKTIASYPNKKVVAFTVAVDREETKGKEGVQKADYFNVEKWVDSNSTFASYLTKGTQVCVQGQLRQDKSQDADGNWQSHPPKITLPDIKLLGASPKGEAQPQQQTKVVTKEEVKDVPWDIDL